jgi:hypothetical protein
MTREDDEDLEPFEVEVEGRSLTIDFGYVSPEYSDDL